GTTAGQQPEPPPAAPPRHQRVASCPFLPPPSKSGRRLRPVPDSRRNRPRLRQHHRSACPQLRLPAAPPTVYTRRKGVIQRGISMARILIVDDSPSQLLGIQRIVEKLGHQTLTAEDGAAGVEVAKAELPDLILMDVVMPNLNGFQATRTLGREATTRDIPVVLVTTKDQDTDRMWGMRQGARAYLTKPFSETELSEVINRLLGEREVASPAEPGEPTDGTA